MILWEFENKVLYKSLLSELVSEIVTSFEVRLAESGGKLIVDSSAIVDTVDADKVHMQNVINTLLDNALKYNDKTPEITITTGRDDIGLFISIADNGIGIPKEFHRKIFEKFFRVPTGLVIVGVYNGFEGIGGFIHCRYHYK